MFSSRFQSVSNLTSQVKQAVLWALEAGYRHIDCAAIYGNEAEIGEALKEMLGPSKVKNPEHKWWFLVQNIDGAHHSDRVGPSASETRGHLHHLQTVEHPASPGGRGARPPEDAKGSPAGVPGPLPHPLAPRFPVSSNAATTHNNQTVFRCCGKHDPQHQDCAF